MNKFKVGDFVVRKAGYLGDNWAQEMSEFPSSPKEVVNVVGGGFLQAKGSNDLWDEDRFKVAELPENTTENFSQLNNKKVASNYNLIGIATGAGKSRELGERVIYQDKVTGRLFYRDLEDFNDRLEIKYEPK